MTIHDVLLKLWSNSKGSTFSKVDEKRLWMTLQAFIENNDGRCVPAAGFDAHPGRKPLDAIQPRDAVTLLGKLVGKVTGSP